MRGAGAGPSSGAVGAGPPALAVADLCSFTVTATGTGWPSASVIPVPLLIVVSSVCQVLSGPGCS